MLFEWIAMNPVYRLENSDAVFSPGLLFYKDLIQNNIQAMLKRTGGPERLRPHVKTHKCPQVVKMQMAAGLEKFKCATIAEAEMVAECGAPDIFLAYPMVGPNVARILALSQKYPSCRFAVTGDNLPALELLSARFAASGAKIGIFLDLDVGQHRTGISAGPAAQELYRNAARLPGLEVRGFHVYDGHNHQEAAEERTQAVQKLLEPVLAMRQELESSGVQVPTIVSGGTPTFPIFARLEIAGLECSPGTCVLHDHGYGSRFADMPEFVPAALILTRVVSKPSATRLTLDIGTKSVASDPPAGKRIVLLNIKKYEPVVHNEEHFVVETPEADQWNPGDVVYAVPSHICPTVALHRQASVIENHRVVEQWPIVGRDRQLTI